MRKRGTALLAAMRRGRGLPEHIVERHGRLVSRQVHPDDVDLVRSGDLNKKVKIRTVAGADCITTPTGDAIRELEREFLASVAKALRTAGLLLSRDKAEASKAEKSDRTRSAIRAAYQAASSPKYGRVKRIMRMTGYSRKTVEAHLKAILREK